MRPCEAPAAPPWPSPGSTRDREVVRFAGVGNISGVIIDAGSRRIASMVSQNGTVGHAVRKIQEFEYPWPEGASLVLHSDGLGDAMGSRTATRGFRCGIPDWSPACSTATTGGTATT